MKRLLTAAIGVPIALVAIFRAPSEFFFGFVAVLFCLAAWEYAQIQRHWAPEGPLWLVVPLVPLVGAALTPSMGLGALPGGLPLVGLLLSVGVAIAVLAFRTPVEQGAPAMGAISFGALYLGITVSALAQLQARSPWLLLLLLAIVWLGDSAAFYVGTRFGRHKLAPVVSPNKSWEGALASLAAAGIAAVAWSLWRGGEVDLVLVALALVTSVAAQIGDLAESLIKRGAGVKDSGVLLPGHGGFLDRFDALTLGAPVWWLALELTGRLPAAP